MTTVDPSDDPVASALSIDHAGSSVRAKSFLSVNAVYVPGITPRLGNDLFTNRGPQRTLGSVSQLEWFVHEGFHTALARMSTGRFLKRLYHALYLVLDSLEDGLELRIPSWNLIGIRGASDLLARVQPILATLTHQEKIVHEALCPVSSILNYRLLLLAGKLQEEDYGDWLSNTLKNIALRAHVEPRSAELAQKMLDLPWVRHGRLGEIVGAQRIIAEIANYSLNVPPSTVRSWWQTGELQLLGLPLNRLENTVELLTGLRRETVSRATRDLEEAHIAKPLLTSAEQVPPDWVREELGQWDDVEPNPLDEMADSLGYDQRRLATHAVGRGIAYLETGYLPRTERETALLRTEGALSESPLFTGQVMALVSDEINGVRDCSYVARWSGRVPLEIWDRLLRGTQADLNLGRFTVMRAPAEVTHLWNLHQVMQQLVFEQTLHCLCGSSCDGTSSCACTELLAPVYQHTRTDAGTLLPKLPCLSGLGV